MNELLQNPIVQSSALPFVVGLVAAGGALSLTDSRETDEHPAGD